MANQSKKLVASIAVLWQKVNLNRNSQRTASCSLPVPSITKACCWHPWQKPREIGENQDIPQARAQRGQHEGLVEVSLHRDPAYRRCDDSLWLVGFLGPFGWSRGEELFAASRPRNASGSEVSRCTACNPNWRLGTRGPCCGRPLFAKTRRRNPSPYAPYWKIVPWRSAAMLVASRLGAVRYQTQTGGRQSWRLIYFESLWNGPGSTSWLSHQTECSTEKFTALLCILMNFICLHHHLFCFFLFFRLVSRTYLSPIVPIECLNRSLCGAPVAFFLGLNHGDSSRVEIFQQDGHAELRQAPNGIWWTWVMWTFFAMKMYPVTKPSSRSRGGEPFSILF